MEYTAWGLLRRLVILLNWFIELIEYSIVNIVVHNTCIGNNNIVIISMTYNIAIHNIDIVNINTSITGIV